MIWLNPWAWVGAATIVLPILIHLLGRGHARAFRFPTLRFLAASRLLPTRRTRIHDRVLLAVRCAAILLATAALARPLILIRQRKQSFDRGLARAIVVDTSASMTRLASASSTALDSARRDAHALATDAAASVIIESAHPSRAVNEANQWLIRQGRRAELVVISDFQRSSIDSGDFAPVAKFIGITLHRIPTISPLDTRAMIDGASIEAHSTVVGDRTDAEWTVTGPAATNNAVVLLGADADRDAMRALGDAAGTIALPLPIDTTRRIAIIFAKYFDNARLKSQVTSSFASWMVDLLGTLRVDSIPLSMAGVANVEGRPRLMLFTEDAPSSFGAARLVVATNRATSTAPSAGELDPVTISDATLAAIRRVASGDIPTQHNPADNNGPSDGRWIWVAVLVLLGVEAVVRSRKRGSENGVTSSVISEQPHAG